MNLKTLYKYEKEGWLMKQTHPELPLTIWNYTQQTQFEGYWNHITLSCRGLVTDDKGNIVARPFRKFFNIEEGKHTPTKDFSVYEKMDGSLGIAFKYEGENIFASRGSFTSDQCLKGIEILNERVNEMAAQPLNDGYTYMFEIIYPENRIVVDYGDMEDVVMLGAINTKTGDEIPYELLKMAHGQLWSIVQKYDGIKDFGKLKSMVKDNQEGFVVQFTNGDRMKIKGEEYVRLHKIMTEVSTKSVWEMLSNDMKIEDFLVDVPDEFFDKIHNEVEKQKLKFKSHEFGVFEYYSKYLKTLGTEDDHNEKRFALWNIQNSPKEYVPILFSISNGRDYKRGIWNMIKPEYKKL